MSRQRVGFTAQRIDYRSQGMPISLIEWSTQVAERSAEIMDYAKGNKGTMAEAVEAIVKEKGIM